MYVQVLHNDGEFAVVWKNRGMGTRGHHPGSLECALKWALADAPPPSSTGKLLVLLHLSTSSTSAFHAKRD